MRLLPVCYPEVTASKSDLDSILSAEKKEIVMGPHAWTRLSAESVPSVKKALAPLEGGQLAKRKPSAVPVTVICIIALVYFRR